MSYPGASRDGDPSLLVGWAGWNHREQAQALATLIVAREQEDGWAADRLVPLVAGLRQILPWVRQWYGEFDPEVGFVAGRHLWRLPRRDHQLAAPHRRGDDLLATGQGDPRQEGCELMSSPFRRDIGYLYVDPGRDVRTIRGEYWTTMKGCRGPQN
ncbi:DUF7008 domain-containing protein [Micromonospora sp. NPDC005252]|uniref:DUF7008 domain-containing protein n=1 Tax=Micromonospora sp. NPDC005252 TaxID=3364228 RepID=UPI00368BC6BF